MIRSFSLSGGGGMIRSCSRLGVNRIRSFSAGVHVKKIGLDDSSQKKYKKRSTKREISYSKTTDEYVSQRLGLDLEKFAGSAIPLSRMITEAKHHIKALGEDETMAIKENVYSRIIEYIALEGFPTEATAKFKFHVHDLVLYILGPIIVNFKNMTGHDIRLRRKMELISPDFRTGGYEGFVLVDTNSSKQYFFVLIIESKRESLGAALRQCLLVMYDVFCQDREGKIFCFITTGEEWRMMSYDGNTFRTMEPFFALFAQMHLDKIRWMKDFSHIVDCFLIALCSGGIQKKDSITGGKPPNLQ